LGLWLQLAIGTIPVGLLIYAFLFGSNDTIATRSSLLIVEYLTFGSLLILAFTAIWFYRYTRFSSQLGDVETEDVAPILQRAAWIGVTASTIGIVFSAVVMMFEVTQLLLYFLRAPQAGVPVTCSPGFPPLVSWVHPLEMDHAAQPFH
jgi:hypothetical protein